MHDLILGINKSVARNMLRAKQVENIIKAIATQDFEELKRLARKPEGFVHDRLRKYVWPILLHTQHGNYIIEKGSEKDLADPVQIAKDVERSLYYYPKGISPILKAQKQQELHAMLVEILWRNPKLKYYQGFHDICTCFLLVLGKKAAIPAAENVALFFLRDAMMDSLEPVSKQLRLMSSIIEYEDPELTLFLERCHVMPYYAISWILTWFSHDFEKYEKIVRLFDLLISSEAMMPVYLSSAVILLRRKEILKADRDLVHSLVAHIPQEIDLESIIQKSTQLQEKYPVLQLQKLSGIWLHEESVIHTWPLDWGYLQWEGIPDHLKVSKYTSSLPKEEWEDEMLLEWTKRRRGSIKDEDF
ncbi:rab-GTPase-TBC domain-containing protein [Sporodiniella umbellata]|nr:rab-GTPase-TBC domain-containing protein [Sporodiniella umbellata]